MSTSLRVTADTSDEDILAPIKAAKMSLSTYVASRISDPNMCGEELVVRAQAVRNAEALASAQLAYSRTLQMGRDKLACLFDLVSTTDDSWSGRGNDSRRAADDVVREWAKTEVNHLWW